MCQSRDYISAAREFFGLTDEHEIILDHKPVRNEPSECIRNALRAFKIQGGMPLDPLAGCVLKGHSHAKCGPPQYLHRCNAHVPFVMHKGGDTVVHTCIFYDE